MLFQNFRNSQFQTTLPENNDLGDVPIPESSLDTNFVFDEFTTNPDKNEKRLSRWKRFLKYLGNVSLAFLSIALSTSPVNAVEVEEATQVLASEGGKEALNQALLKTALCCSLAFTR